MNDFTDADRPRVLIVGAHPLFRYAVAALAGAMQWVAVCGEAADEAVARRLCEERRPDVVVLDADSTAGDGLALVRDFRGLLPAGRILVVSERGDAEFLQEAFAAGAAGYVSKHDPTPEIASGIEWLARTDERFVGWWMRERLFRLVTDGTLKARHRGADALSGRELEVYRLLGRGKRPADLALGMGVSVKTVDTHCRRIQQKLGVRSREELRRSAVQWTAGGEARAAA